jgi:DNA-binding transcriptional regulator YdaS (Cro superfamily)
MTMKPLLKIPSRLAPHLGVSKSLVVRWSQGKRKLPYEMAMCIVDLLRAEGRDIDILDLMPELEELIPYLCGSHAKQRKLRQKPLSEADRSLEEMRLAED